MASELRQSLSTDGNKPRRSLVHHSSTGELTSQYDYALVFPMVGFEQTNVIKYVVQSMHEAKMETFSYKSIQDDELIVLFRCPLEVLKKFADEIDYTLELSPKALREKLAAGVPDASFKSGFLISPIKINDDPKYSALSPYIYIFGKYDEDLNQDLYYVPDEQDSAFTKQIRLKLLYQMLRAPKFQGGCGLEISKLVHKKKILSLFPLHDHSETKQINDLCWQWSTTPWTLPIEDFRQYFGEKIALFLVFVGHYSYWLIIPAVIGIIFQLVVWGTVNFSSPVLPFYSVIICVWSIFMLEFWKQKENMSALQWGTTDFEQAEMDRPEFKGHAIESFINGKPMLYFPPNERFDNVIKSGTVVYAFVILVLGIVTSIYIMRFSIANQVGTYASTIASLANTVQITVFNIIYQSVAVRLTDAENLRTDTEFEDSMIIKLFIFQFINSYSSFFFLAFIAQQLDKPADDDSVVGQCGASNCMQPLSINLAIIFGTRLTVRNFLDIFIPYLMFKKKVRQETKGVEDPSKLTPAERDYMLMDYNGLIENINNYADLAVQYGYSMLFVTALPSASFFGLISNYFKVKFNTWKLCTFYQRPVPIGVQDIGTWMSIFQFISVAAVVTNAGLVCFTMDVIDDFSDQGKVWIFVGFNALLIFVQFIAMEIVPDEPDDYLTQLKRMEFIISKVIEKVPDEDVDITDGDGSGNKLEHGGVNEDHISGGCCQFLPCCRSHGGKYLERKIPTDGLIEVNVERYPTGAMREPTTDNPLQH